MSYPNAVQFKPEHSVNNQGLLDLTLSYNHKVIAQKRSNLTVGNKVLVCTRIKGKALHVYSAIITTKLDYPASVWFNHGGKLWKSNWEVEPTSEVVYLTEEEIKSICGSRMNWHVFNSSFMGNGRNKEPVGKPRARLVEYLETNHPA
tara:strand:- start:23 stop:463 length:441 start_codon:yes stop_codon:yes gene_type:complete